MALMACLPPVGWADVATKHDLDVGLAGLEARMDLRFQALDERVATKEYVERALKDLSTKFFLGMTAQTVAMTGLVFAAARLMG